MLIQALEFYENAYLLGSYHIVCNFQYWIMNAKHNSVRNTWSEKLDHIK
jgi:hypothetical protein